MMKTQKDIFLAFSERLKFLREENQFTQKELSDRLKMLNYNISEDMISAFERGISEPKLSQIHAFCILLRLILTLYLDILNHLIVVNIRHSIKLSCT